MKKTLLTVLVLSVCLSGCAGFSNQTESTPSTNTPPATTETPVATAPTIAPAEVKQQPMAAVYLPVFTENKTAEDGTVILTHTYQDISLTIQESAVADKVIVDFLNRTDSTQLAQAMLADAKDAYQSDAGAPLPYLHKTTYEPMRIDQGILSLYGGTAVYQGGAHGEHVPNAITYDLLTGNALTCSAVLLEIVTADDIIPLINEALKPQAGELFPDYETTVAEKFANGTDSNSDWFLSDKGLCFFFSPYEIGPFATGTVIAEIPYSKLTGILRDDYFPSERDRATGKVQTVSFDDADLTAFTQFTELITDADAPKKLLFTDSSVQDVRISAQYDGQNHVLFAAYGLTPGDAIMIQSSHALELTYTSGDETVNETLTAQ